MQRMMNDCRNESNDRTLTTSRAGADRDSAGEAHDTKATEIAVEVIGLRAHGCATEGHSTLCS